MRKIQISANHLATLPSPIASAMAPVTSGPTMAGMRPIETPKPKPVALSLVGNSSAA